MNSIVFYTAMLYATALLMVPVTSLLVPVKTLEPQENKETCDIDGDCPQNSFCFNAECNPCFECGKVFRENQPRCAKDPSDCGRCLPGYKEDSYRTSHYRWCRQESTAERHQMDNPDDSKFKFSMQWITAILICCLFVLGFASYYCYSSKRHHNSWTTDVRANYQFSNPPPPYKEDNPTNDHSTSSFQLQVIGNSEGHQQKAVPFLYVENMRTEIGESNSTIHIQTAPTANSGTETFTSVNLDIHDETTVPSAWTPGEAYGEANDQKNEDESPPKKRKKSSDEQCDDKKESQLALGRGKSSKKKRFQESDS